ncbi:extracellular triacylglycerol lipase precursor [Mycena rebaudengoi]|nr:extracellular triacylglycerol lipase precursor [Mycena rebaudengoi]
MFFKFNLVASLALLLCVNSQAPTIQLGETTLVGRDVTLLRQDFFGGIPFAEPPLGSLRLRPPVLKSSLDPGIFNATSFGLACLQMGVPANLMSEDCLTINVFRPSGTPANAKLPVLFWTYGGGFQSGTASIYNGSGIVAQSVARGTPLIYVNFNYRLGPLGFPQGQEADDRSSLNLALKDELIALEWVQLHIETFGGDKTKVTVFGQSAGSVMTAALFLNSPISRLARAAIFESGFAATAPLFPAARREATWQQFVSGVPSCVSTAKSGSTFDCLRAANTTDIFQGLATAAANPLEPFPWDPVLDGAGGLIPELPSVLFKKGKFARLPFIAGTNLDEGTAFIPQDTNSTAQIHDGCLSLFTPSVSPSLLELSIQAVLKLYPDVPALGSPFNTGNETFGLSSQFKRSAAIDGDVSFQSQRRLWMETAANAGVKTFGYLFTQPQPTLPPAFGVTHATEITYVYTVPNDRSASALKISSLMTDYWVSFATSLDPNDGRGVPRPHWDQFTPQNKVVIQLNGDNTTMIPDTYRAANMAFFNSDPVIWRH